jgi:hypothetical protein
MKNVARRSFLGLLAASLGTAFVDAGSFTKPRNPLSAPPKPGGTSHRIPVLHVTDLYRPHDDPDDHWDLACVYALAYEKAIDLRAVLIDAPIKRPEEFRDPDVLGVAQMNHLTQLSVPITVGCPVPMKSRDDLSSADHSAIRTVHEILRSSPEPVVINILGSSRDIAIAGKSAPSLFAEKCAAIYLNAGLSTTDLSLPRSVRFDQANVNRDISGFAAIFDLPCPVYWIPVLETWDMEGMRRGGVNEFASLYRFRQDEILPHLSDRVQNFFAYMFRDGRTEDGEGGTDPRWFQYLYREKDNKILDHQGGLFRYMWCTGGFLHSAGLTVNEGGEIVDLKGAGDDVVFRFDAVKISCDDEGFTDWELAENDTNRYIFHVCNRENYTSALIKAMKTLLMKLP